MNRPNGTAKIDEPAAEQAVRERLRRLEVDTGKGKRAALLGMLFGFVLGSGGVLGIVQWLYTAPKTIAHEEERLEAERERSERERHEADMKSILSAVDAAEKLGKTAQATVLRVQLLERQKATVGLDPPQGRDVGCSVFDEDVVCCVYKQKHEEVNRVRTLCMCGSDDRPLQMRYHLCSDSGWCAAPGWN